LESCPCKGCGNRSPKCHGRCEKYTDWQVAHEKRRREIKKQRQEETDVASIMVRSFLRVTVR
jgi:predicted ATP-dependent serine protease